MVARFSKEKHNIPSYISISQKQQIIESEYNPNNLLQESCCFLKSTFNWASFIACGIVQGSNTLR